MTEDFFPIPPLESLPARVKNCAIFETIIEIRHKSPKAWTLVPGLVYSAIGEKYPDQVLLGANQLPAQFLESNANLQYTPVLQFKAAGDKLVQLGHSMISLNFGENYPGWEKTVRPEFEWLLEKLRSHKILGEGVRLGLRYRDFFEGIRILPNLRLSLSIDGQNVDAPEASIILNLKRGRCNAKLQIHNSATRKFKDKIIKGSVMDIDTSVEAADFDINTDIVDRLEELHGIQKVTFFGLLTPDFLNKLGPEPV